MYSAILMGLFTAISGPTLANSKELPSKKSLTVLNEISAEMTEGLSVITIRLSQTPPWKKVYLEDHGGFLQIILPETIVPSSGEFVDLDVDYITKAASFQINPTRAAVRLFLTKNTETILPATEADVLDRQIVVTIDHNKLTPPTEVAATASPAGETAKDPAPARVAKTTPADMVASTATTKKAEKATGFTLNDRLNQLTIALSMLLILIIVGVGLRQTLVRRRKDDDKRLVLKDLGNLALSAKQKLSLIQVGNEQILIAVSPNNVSLITHVGKEKVAQPPIARNPTQAVSAPELAKRLTAARTPRAPEPAEPQARKRIAPKPEPKTAPRPNRIANTTPTPELNTKKRINVAIGDNGIVQNNSSSKTEDAESRRAVDDVTRLIREKLKNLPKI